jgi:hypothetical protein
LRGIFATAWVRRLIPKRKEGWKTIRKAISMKGGKTDEEKKF